MVILSSVVEPEPEPQEPKLFALAELEPECIKVPVSEPDLDQTQNGKKSQKNPKGEANILGNNTASDYEKARFCKKNLLLKTVVNVVWIRNRNQSRNRNMSRKCSRNWSRNQNQNQKKILKRGNKLILRMFFLYFFQIRGKF